MIKTILLSDITSYKSIVVARFVKKNYPNIRIIGFDYLKTSKVLHTKYCDLFFQVPVPELNKPKHLKAISNIIHDQKIDLFIPTSSNMYGEYIGSRKLFNKTLDYVGDYSTYQTLHNKGKLHELAVKLSIPVPNRYSCVADAKIPFIVKPTDQSSAKGVKYILNDNQKSKLKPSSENNIIVQEYIIGKGCGFSVFAKDGDILKGYGHERLAEYPVSGGSSVYRDSFFNQKMEDYAKRILKQTEWSGFAMFEFKQTPDNKIILIEVNPRIWGSINQGLQNGANYFEFLLGKLLFNKSKNIKTYLSPSISISLLAYIFRFKFTPLMLFLSQIRNNSVDVCFYSDPRGYAGMLTRKLL